MVSGGGWVIGRGGRIVGGGSWIIGGVRVCDQWSRLICERGLWPIGGSVISSLL